MKKLLIAMTAAAVGTCAWAEGDAGGTTPNYLNEDFSEWSLTAPWSYGTIKDGEFSALDAAGDGELTLADGKLSLNTGSKVLRGNFMSDGSAKDIDTGLYFKSTVTFKDPSDTLPTLGAQDKFALVVLDNVESFEANPKLADTQTTNLWVIAKYGADENVKRAYKLNINGAGDSVIQNLDADWLSDEHTIVVKAYDNVMAATPNRAGFLVMVDGYVCTVDYSCAIVDGVIDFKNGVKYSENNGVPEYLGFAATDIHGSVRKRYTDNQLLLSMTDNNATLKSVDFQGQGVIDDVEFTADGTGLDFGTDSLAIAVTAAGPGVTLTGECAEGTLFYSGSSATVTFTLKAGFALASEKVVYDDDKTYSVTINPADYADGYTIASYWPKVSIDGNVYGSLAEAIEEADEGATISLREAVVVTDAIDVSADITIDLNGKKISAVLTEDLEAMFALGDGVTLTITDNATGGVLEVTGVNRTIASAPLRQKAVVAIKAGTIDAAVVTGELLEYNITGGKFLKAANASITVDTNKYVVDADTEAAYYIVKDKPAAPSTFAVTYTAGNFTLTKLNGETYEAFTSGTELANGTYTFKVAAAEGYDIVSVTVGDNATELTDGAFSVTVNGAAVAIDVTTREVKYPETENLVTGDVTTDDVAEALDELATALGGDTAVTNFITQVCGGSIDAATLVDASKAGTLGLSVNYDLPLMTEVPEVEDFVAEAASDDDAAAFSFQITVDATPIEIKKVTDNVRKMIEYGTSLSGMNALTPQDTGVKLELSGTKIKVKLLKQNDVKSGFMKVKLNK